MEKLINGNLVKKVVAYKTAEDKHWIHVTKKRFLFLEIECDYWYWNYICLSDKFSTEELIKHLADANDSFYKDGKVYNYPCIDFIFDYRHSETKYFNSDEEMFAYLEEFKQQFGKSFILV